MEKRGVVVGVAVVASVAAAAFAIVNFRRYRQSTRPAKSNARILIPRPTEFRQKRAEIIRGGFDNLQVIVDFDNTLTHAFVEGKRSMTCHGILESAPSFSHKFKENCKTYFDHYHPLEVSHTLTLEEKIPLMVEWYTKAHTDLLEEKVTPTTIANAVRAANTILRTGAHEMITLLQTRGVPLLVFSAGVGNVIEEFLHQHFGDLADTTHIISNWLDLNQSVPTFREPLIHMFNKDERQTEGTPYAESVRQRRNVMLLGDGVGDVTMANGVSHNVVLKVGFLNANENELLPKFTSVYDVIVFDDGSMDLVNHILQTIA
eukprot:c12039_g1_i1.p1 GENE.c12039_g1_i1~~c12039_g1_i1.p1  ORF type:complete len:317 (+),score=62.66 c12039_g1_i1:371-1321(+)